MRAMSYSVLKRLIDLGVAALGLPLLAVLVPLVAVAVKLDSPGPVFYSHVRCGKAGRRFRMLKFRTMQTNADRIGAAVTTADDPRVTRVGRLLRKSKLDELPQIWNVLLGDMSLVGPRPQSPHYIRHNYPDEQRRVILSIRPGITGPTQIWCRNEEEVLAASSDPDAFYKHVLLPKKIASDVAYARRPNLLTDLRCLLLTLLICLPLRPLKGYSATAADVADLEMAEPSAVPIQ
ncbi:MAG: glycosyl transferase [Fimbriimonadales bacterium]